MRRRGVFSHKNGPRAAPARYTVSVLGKLFFILGLAAALFGQQDKTKPKSTDSSKPVVQEQAPPEEDENVKPREYPFNPLEAQNDVKVGNFYFKQGKYKAAINRFRDATRFNPSFAEAFLRLGDAEDKMGDKQAASDAYEKYLELAPDAKNADVVKKKIVAKH
jgi:tetratricopeptide (TPR) repeat protein